MRAVDVLVVGAGPAGASAALAAAANGATTVLVDEQPAVGGHLRWTTTRIAGLSEDIGSAGLRGFELAGRLAERIAASPVKLLSGGIAWGWFEGNIVSVAHQDRVSELRARSIVVASGSTDRMQSFPGATLPGVMTDRAVRIFLTLHRVLPGRRFVVIGGAEADAVADEIEAAGGEVVVRWAGVDGLSVSGPRGVERVTTGGRAVEADVVAVCLGLLPDPGLAMQAQVALAYWEPEGAWLPRRGPSLETSVPGLFVAGDAAGSVSDVEAIVEGRLAGLEAAGAAARAIVAARRELNRLRSPADRRRAAALGLPDGPRDR